MGSLERDLERILEIILESIVERHLERIVDNIIERDLEVMFLRNLGSILEDASGFDTGILKRILDLGI